MKQNILIIYFFILFFSACSRKEMGLDPEIGSVYQQSVRYNLICFNDIDGKGIYLLDTRYMYKNMLYFFDFEKNQWFPISDGDGLPKLSKYQTLHITNAFSVNSDSIIAISDREEFFVYSIATNRWKTTYSGDYKYPYYDPNQFYSNYNNQSDFNQYVFNKFDNHIYRSLMYSSGNYALDYLDPNLEWQRKLEFTSEAIDSFILLRQCFKDNNNIQLIAQKVHPYNPDYYDSEVATDSVYTVFQINTSTGINSPSKNIKLKFDLFVTERSLSGFTMQNVDNELYVFDYNSYFGLQWGSGMTSDEVNYGILQNIPVDKNTLPMKSDTLEYSFLANPENIERLGDVIYSKYHSEPYLFKKDASFYLFLNGFGFKYSILEDKWSPLPPLPFNQLNAQ